MAYNYNGYYPYYTPSYQTSMLQNEQSMRWVDGEVGAKAFQMPQGWPSETPIVLWDNSEKKIYLKSWNQMGMPNPMQELDYEIKERTNPALLPSNISGAEASNYVTKEDFDQLKQELKNMISNMNTNNNGNRGGSR